MRKNRWLWLFLCVAFLLPVARATAQGENLLSNPGFEDVLGGTGFADWTKDMWYREEGASYLSVSTEAWDGQASACVENVSENDARFVQTAAVKPDTVYRISCMVRAEGCPRGSAGANISVKGTLAASDSAYETGDGWVPLEIYGRTGAEQSELTVMARVGGYGSLNTGKAWFDSFEMTEAEEIPAGVTVLDFDGDAGDISDADDAPDAQEDAAPSAMANMAVNALYILCACALVCLAATGRMPERLAGEKALAAVMGVAFALRVALAVTVRGYGVDMTDFQLWASRVAQTGPAGFYAADYFCDYPPGYMWVLYLVGCVQNALGLAYDSRGMWLLTKLPAILLDMAAVWMLYRMAKEALGEKTAALVGALYALCPAVLINSAAWGQIDATLAILLMAALYHTSRKRWVIALPLYTLSVLIKPQALMFGPIGLFVAVLEAWGLRGMHSRVIGTSSGGKVTIRLQERHDVVEELRQLGMALIGCLLVILAVAGPFLARVPKDLAPNGLVYLFRLYGNTMGHYDYITVNACNFYTMLNLNWRAMGEVKALAVLAYAVLALAIAYACYLYYRSARRDRLFLVCAVFLTAAYTFGPMMHERYLFPALLLLLAAYAADRDMRILGAFFVMAFTLGANEWLVLQNEYLLSEQQPLNAFLSLINVLNCGLICWTAWDVCVGDKLISFTKVYQPKRAQEEKRRGVTPSLFRVRDYRLGMRKTDWALMLALTAVYACVSFANLGATQAPQTQWTSSAAGEEVTFDLGQSRVFRMTYYGGICSSTFTAQFSEDGETWTDAAAAEYDMGTIFRWLWYRPGTFDEYGEYAPDGDDYPYVTARYARLRAVRAGLVLSEVAFLDADGATYPIQSVYAVGGAEGHISDPKALIDEQFTVPAAPSWFNGTYFDEIYHARTGYEFAHGMSAYEWTHPPLGKVFIMLGINLFSMTPFGWRFMGALFGVLMIPVIYLMGKQLFKRTDLSFLAAFLLAADLMHFTQTRIATIDTFVVLFVMLQYLFMIRYCQMSFFHQKLSRTLIPLALSGVCMGLGMACKWTGAYAGLGLAVLFFFSIGQRTYEYHFARKHAASFDAEQRKIAQRAQRQYVRALAVTLGLCLAFFVAIPLCIYYFSYYWQMIPEGGLRVERVWRLQQDMFSYHMGLADDTHSFRSPWWQWPIIAKPMWYYSGYDFTPYDVVSSISCMGNPVVWWGGLAAMVCVLARMVSVSRGDRRYLFVGVGFLAQYVPWMFISRSTFIYHYFASVPFIILATALMADYLRRRMSVKAFRWAIAGYCAAALALFVMFYPIASGQAMPRDYAGLLRWFNWYNFR